MTAKIYWSKKKAFFFKGRRKEKDSLRGDLFVRMLVHDLFPNTPESSSARKDANVGSGI